MKSVTKTLLILIGSCLLSAGFSQQPLRIQLANDSLLQYNVDTGTSFSFNVWIINEDSSVAYTGPLGFAYSIDSVDYFNPNILSGFEFNVAHEIILPHDTLTRNIIAHVSQPKFYKTGPSVVVIWPITTGDATVGNSLQFTFNISIPTGIEQVGRDQLRLFTTNNLLWLIHGNEIQLHRLKIFNITGQQILERADPSDNVPLPDMDTGIYLAEITYNDNQRKTFRFYY